MTPRVVRHLVFNVAGPVSVVLVVAVTAPLYLQLVGLERYGVIALVGTLAGFSSVFDLGLGRSAANALSRARGDPRQRAEILWTVLSLNLLLAVFAGSVAFFAVRFILGKLARLTPPVAAEAWAIPACVCALVVSTLLSGVAVGALESREKFAAVNAIQAGSGAAAQIGTLLVAAVVGVHLSLLIAVMVTVQIAAGVAMGALALRFEAMGRPRLPPPRVAASLLSYGGWIAITNLLSPLLEAGDQLCVVATQGASRLPFYAVPMNIVQRLQLFPTALSRSLFPSFSRLAEEDTLIVALGALDAARFVFPAIFGAAIIGAPFALEIWMGRDFAQFASTPLRLLAIGAAFNAMAYLPFSVLQAGGRPHVVAWAHLAEMPPYFILLSAATQAGGISAAAGVWTLRVLVDSVILMLASKMIRVGGWEPIITAAALMGAAALVARIGPSGPASLLCSFGYGLACVLLGVLLSPLIKGHARATYSDLRRRLAPDQQKRRAPCARLAPRPAV